MTALARSVQTFTSYKVVRLLGVNNNNNNTYIALFLLLLAQSALHSVTPGRIASLGNLTYCCHARRRRQYPLKLGTHIFPWVERGTDQANILPKDVILHETVCITGDRTHDPWIISPTPYQLSHIRPMSP